MKRSSQVFRMEASMITKNRTLLVGLLLGGLITLVIGVVADSAEAVTVTVTTKDDRDDGVCPSKPLAPVLSRIPCTLRAAIAAVNSQPAGTGPHRINFAVGYGNQTINVLAYLGPLPAITRPVFIDGQSQQRYTKPCVPLVLEGCGGGTLAPCHVPCIAVSGMYAGSPVDGLTLAAGSDGSTIRNLLINNFLNGVGIRVNSTNNFIQGNYIGTDAAGTFAQPSTYKMDTGVFLGSASFNTTINAGNVISGNKNGVVIDATGMTQNYMDIAKRTNHNVLGNRIGTNAAGTAVIGNDMYGVYIKNASANVVGGGNLIGGNFYGVSVASSTSVYPTVENRVFETYYDASEVSGGHCIS
jgi:CSLREA domain-containing protein